METKTILYIVIAGIVALGLALFQYYKKNEKSMYKLNMLFSFLRFISLFSILLLIINPQFIQSKVTVEKPNLVVAVDNSKSIKYLKEDSKSQQLVEQLKHDSELNKKFNLSFYTLGEVLKPSDSLSFLENQTNIYDAFKQLNQIYKQTTSPTILITDGNQTFGNDYQFISNSYRQPIFPVVLGDTLSYVDLKIEQLNVNKYAFLNNKFPVEVILVYNGEESINTNFTVSQGNRGIYRVPVSFSKEKKSQVLNFTLPATNVGFSNYKATITPIETEKNKQNNTSNFSVEVINQKTKIAIVSDFSHPDLGVFKKSLESNKQRSVSILSPREFLSNNYDFQVVVLYQPNNSFENVLKAVNEKNLNKFVIIGGKTDLHLINTSQNNYEIEITNQTENYQAAFNGAFAPFIVEDIDFESFPPLQSFYGSVIFSTPFQVILNKTIKGVSTNEPLLITLENNKNREVVLFAENIWQWRAQSYLNSQSFNEFDDFMGKLIQFLNTNNQRNRLNIDYNSFYNSGSNIIIKAEYFDKNFVFDARESLTITVVSTTTNDQRTLPLVVKNNNYQVDLSSLLPSEYNFTIKTSKDNLTKSGRFEVLDYNVEQQFLSADVTKLNQIATNSSGKTFFINNTSNLISTLLSDNRFTPIQKSTKNTVPLIDWKYLLAILALSLGIEWFLRKYNGLT